MEPDLKIVEQRANELAAIMFARLVQPGTGEQNFEDVKGICMSAVWMVLKEHPELADNRSGTLMAGRTKVRSISDTFDDYRDYRKRSRLKNTAMWGTPVAHRDEMQYEEEEVPEYDLIVTEASVTDMLATLIRETGQCELSLMFVLHNGFGYPVPKLLNMFGYPSDSDDFNALRKRTWTHLKSFSLIAKEILEEDHRFKGLIVLHGGGETGG